MLLITILLYLNALPERAVKRTSLFHNNTLYRRFIIGTDQTKLHMGKDDESQ